MGIGPGPWASTEEEEADLAKPDSVLKLESPDSDATRADGDGHGQLLSESAHS
jgi:hypothetical protein